eukprot:scaffold3.g6661.t1
MHAMAPQTLPGLWRGVTSCRSQAAGARRPAGGPPQRPRSHVPAAADPGGAPTPRAHAPHAHELAPGTLLGGGRYEVLEALGSGSSGITYRCRDVGAARDVAVKVLSLRGLRDWKQLELFEREAQTLKSLDHPGIPRYLEWFEEDTEQDRAFCLVQELARGRTLEELVRSGWRADEGEVARVGAELLRTLRYLGGRRPPVIHRDVKPQNVVLEGGEAGGRVFLVDFGGVQAAGGADADRMGSTVVGTYGFMAPEAFRGAAQPESDLYGLGATLLFLLSGRPPSAFPLDRMRLDFSGVPMGPRLQAVIDGLLEPVVEDRLTADDALALLAGERRAARRGAGAEPARLQPVGVRRRQPAGSKIKVVARGPRLEIDIPPAGFTSESVATGAFAIAERLVINLKTWRLEQQLALLDKGRADWSDAAHTTREAGGRSLDLSGARLSVGAIVNGQPQYQLELLEGAFGCSTMGHSCSTMARGAGAPCVNRYMLAEGLPPVEQEWLAGVINDHLQARGWAVLRWCVASDNAQRLQDLGGALGGGEPPRELPGRSEGTAGAHAERAGSSGGGGGAGGGGQRAWSEAVEGTRAAAEEAAWRAATEAREAGERVRRTAEAAAEEARGRAAVGGQLWQRARRGRERGSPFDDAEDDWDAM